MKKERQQIIKVDSIVRLHEIAGLPKPRHPLMTIIDFSKTATQDPPVAISYECDFYSINFKKHCKFIYGRQEFDHEEGTLHCTAPGQVIRYDPDLEKGSTGGWGIYFHADLIRQSDLGRKIHQYGFFSYDANEALHLSEDEKTTLFALFKQIEREYFTGRDQFSHNLIIDSIELLLNYCRRFYHRQFITRNKQNKDIITKFEKFLHDYVYSDQLKTNGMPSVKYCASSMNLSTHYFSDLLKNETGKNAQDHIHYQILEKAKNLLLSSDRTVNDIARELGFEYAQYFSKLFKKKIGVTPKDFRAG